MSALRLKVDMERVRELIEQGYNNKQIARELNIAVETLSRNLKENNLKVKDKKDTIIGKVFGKLKVLERKENTGDRRRTYLCQCECGNTTMVKSKYLNNGDTRSCGCYKDFTAYQEKNYKEALKHVGEKHGMLTVIDVELHEKGHKYQMICKCECGTVSKKFYGPLQYGETISCGCFAKEQASKRMSKLVQENFNSKKKWYFIKDGIEIRCRSGYEVIYANYLVSSNIEFEYEPKIFKLQNGKRYTPDFYLVNEDKYIEIKGLAYDIIDRGNQKERFDMFSKKHDIDLLLWDDLYDICNLPFNNYSGYGARAKKINMKVEDYLGKGLYLNDIIGNN